MKCQFNLNRKDQCDYNTKGTDIFCDIHMDLKCQTRVNGHYCNKPAVFDCNIRVALTTCGYDYCADCGHCDTHLPGNK
jgi:hypothetical protein